LIGLAFIFFLNNNIEEKRKEKVVGKFAGFLPCTSGFLHGFAKFGAFIAG